MKNIFIARKENVYTWILVFFLVLIIGGRGQTNDTQVYYNVFKLIPYYDFFDAASFYEDTRMEIGFGYFLKIIHFFSSSSFFLFSIVSFIIFFLYIKISINLKLNSLLLVLIYILSGFFIFQQFMQIRQALSTFLYLYAALIFFDKKFFISIFLFALSMSIHQTAFLPVAFFLLVLICFKIFVNLNKVGFFIISLLGLIVAFFLSKYFLINFLIASSEAVEGYLNSDFGNQVSIFGFNNIRMIVCYIFIFYLFFKNFNGVNIKYKFLFLSLTAGIGMKFGMLEIDILSGRLTTPFTIAELFLIVYLVFKSFSKSFSNILILLYILGLFIPAYFFQIDFQDFVKLYLTPLY